MQVPPPYLPQRGRLQISPSPTPSLNSPPKGEMSFSSPLGRLGGVGRAGVGLYQKIPAPRLRRGFGGQASLFNHICYREYLLHLFSPILLRTPSRTIDTSSLWSVFLPQLTNEPDALSLMSFIVAFPSLALMLSFISSRL
ncbi:MAG: hypothetical protein UU82_C0002G0040 [Candidatus Nomurabacteria bacterium GW2011_GWC2_41_8]|uniref:Uncharacterized protein n=2 Tax=Candidatus Nomuraibacteriota TaxID=1752729 RepID=A0A0G0XIG1_9BACT|nr:MAG: hypothetical protein UU58_C0002G0042 [Candidatus Nomurabacteria bacterium GW2011_GWA2_41_25]KKS24675.1 MAG: hypothetical protein UU82_C0002G0040 [Candidatus Nomurabacteria bacterium GW2011_GWC2_41_8]